MVKSICSCQRLAWLFIAVPFIVGCVASTPKPIIPMDISREDTCSARTVFVGDMGNDEHVPRFRILLEKSLRELGYIVLTERQQADLILSGAMYVNNGRAGMYGEIKTTQVYATVKIETSQGLVWTIDTSPKRGRGDHVAIRAKEVAENVLQACRQGWKE